MSHYDPDKYLAVIDAGMKLKDSMVKRKIFKKPAQAICPLCEAMGEEGRLIGRLYPNKRFKHGYAIHFSCTGPCKSMMME